MDGDRESSRSDEKQAGGSAKDEAGLDSLLARYIDRMNEGEKLVPEKILAEHPEQGKKILDLLADFVELDAGHAPASSLGSIGDFKLLRQIGRGGMGVVYEAWQASMDRRVALKVLPAGLAGDSASFTRFLREARTAGKLHHPNIVAVHALGVHESTPYYAMEYVDGETLAQILARSGSGTEDAAGEGEAKESGRLPRARRRSKFLSEDERRKRLSPILGLFRKPESGKRTSRLLAQTLAPEASREGAALPGGSDASEPELCAEALASGKTAFESGEGALESHDSAAQPPGETAPQTKEITALYSYLVAQAFAEVADGLRHAHEHGIVHRDIKPSNLILDREGRLRILDFGLAHLEGQESLTRSGDLVGTVLYMSPEQAMARRIPIDHRTDVYSLGATLYETLTWAPPFRGKSYQDTLSHIVLRDPQLPRKLNPRIPRDLETIVLKCLRKDPADRYGTAEALAQDLRRFVKGDPIEAHPQASLERLARRAWRNKGKVAAACLVALLLLTSGLLFYRHRLDATAAKLALYREKVLGAIGKMELGRPVRHAVARGTPASGRHPGAADEAPSSDAPSGEISSGVAFAATLEPAVPLVDPLEEARQELEEAIRLFPGRPEAHYQMARSWDLAAEETDARTALENSLACDPLFVPARVLRETLQGGAEEETAARVSRALEAVEKPAWASAWLAACEAKAGKRWKEAAEACSRLVEALSGGEEPYLGLLIAAYLEGGRARLEAGDPDGALESFAMVRALWPDLAEPVILLGKVFIRKGEAARAEERFAEFHAKAKRPDDFARGAAHLYEELGDWEKGLLWAERIAEGGSRERNRAICLWKVGRLEEGLEAAGKALSAEPEVPESHEVLGMLLDEAGKVGEAVAELRRAVELGAKGASVHWQLAISLSHGGQDEEATAEYRKALEHDPKLAPAHVNLGDLHRKKGKLDDAIAECLKALEIDPKLANAHLNLGKYLSDQGKADEAAAEYWKALELDPKLALAHNNVGCALSDQGKIEEAIEHFRKAIELDPKRAMFHSNLGAAIRGQAKIDESRGKVEESRGKLEESIVHLRKALELDPGYVCAHLSMGQTLSAQGSSDEAIAEFRRAIEIDPKLARARVSLGNHLRDQGKTEEAIAEYRKALALDPKFGWAHNSLASALRQQGKLDEAMSAYRAALEVDSRSRADAHFGLGLCFFKKGSLEESAAEYRKAIELKPKLWEAHLNLGNTLHDQGKLEEAMSAYRAAIEVDPLKADARCGLGLCFHEKGSLEEAAAEYRKAIDLEPKHPGFRTNLGAVLADLGKDEEAIAEYRSDLELDPALVDTRLNLVNALHRLKRFEDAAGECRKVLEQDAKSAKAHLKLAESLEHLEKLEEAVVEYRRAAELSPGDAESHEGLGGALLALALQGRAKLEEAEPELRRAVELDPKKAHAEGNLGTALAAQGKREAALESFRRAAELDPEDADLRRDLGLELLSQGKVDEAIPELRKATEIAPTEAELHGLLGLALFRQDKLDEALPVLRKSVELDPSSPSPHWNLGNTLCLKGDLEAGLAEYRKAAELAPNSPEAFDSQGDALLDLRRLAEAEAAYRKAAELWPEWEEPHCNLGRTLQEQGKPREALAEYRKAQELGCDDSCDSILEVLRTSRRADLSAEVAALIPVLEARAKPEANPDRDREPDSHPEPNSSPHRGLDPDVWRLKALAFALACDSPARDPRKAVESARRALEKAGASSPDELTFLAEVEWLSGEREAAVATLEKAVKLPGANLHHLQVLSELRRGLLPIFATRESIDAALDQPAVEALVPGDAEWRFFRGKCEPSPGTEWTAVAFDDSGWERGLGGFGSDYGRSRNRDLGTALGDMQDRDQGYASLCTRHRFSIPDPGAFRKLRLVVYADDGFIAYLNGKEVGRHNAGDPGSAAPFPVMHGGVDDGRIPVEVSADAKDLLAGENCLAVQGLHEKRTPFYLEAILEAERAPDPSRAGKLVEEFRGAARDEGARARVSYMEERVRKGQ